MGRTGRWVTQGTLLLLAAHPLPARGELDASAPLADDPTVIALAVALACAEPPDPPAPEAASAPAVEVVATVRARSLVLEEVPRADAVLAAAGGARVTWRAERVNLPRHPQPGVVYGDVEVRLTIAASEPALLAMLGEARRAAGGIRIEEAEGLPSTSASPTATSTPTPTATPTPTLTPTPN